MSADREPDTTEDGAPLLAAAPVAGADTTNGPPPAAPSASPARSLRVMAALRWLILLASAGVAAGTWWTLVVSPPPPTVEAPLYYCPMHPDITAHEPGTCPICFMNLEPIPDDRLAAADEVGTPVTSTSEPGDLPPGTSSVMLTTERRQLSGIASVEARSTDFGGEARWPAAIEAREGGRAEVRVRVEAFVERVVVRESGTLVRAGQPLAYIYAPEILQAEEELLAAGRWPGGTDTSESAAPVVSARRRLALLGVPEADIAGVVRRGAARRTIPVRAPIAGTVIRAGAVLGSRTGPDEALFEIADLSRVRIVASVIGRPGLAPNEIVSARFARAGDGVPIDVELELIEPAVEGATRATRVRFVADNASGLLRPGDIGEVSVVVPTRTAIVVPRDAVIDTGTDTYVFVEHEAGRFEPRVVSAGAALGGEREILAGLEAGERVVARGAFVLDSESRLQAALAPLAVLLSEDGNDR
jgi:Cu(I)/Ag(I) efflux system membrane fusion protein